MNKIEERLKEIERWEQSSDWCDLAASRHFAIPQLIQALREAVVYLDNMKRARERDQSGAPRLSLIDVSALADNTLTRIEALLTEGK